MPEIKIVTEVAGRVCALAVRSRRQRQRRRRDRVRRSDEDGNPGDVDDSRENQGISGQDSMTSIAEGQVVAIVET